MTGSVIAHFGLAKQYRNLKHELLDATDQVLRGGCLMDGPFTNKFETWLALKTGTEFAVTVHSGTQALEIIALWLRSQWFTATQSNIRPLIQIPNITYPATLNAFINTDFEIELLDTDKNGLMVGHDIERTACLVGLYGAKTQQANSNNIVDGAQHWLVADSSSIGMGMAISFDPTKNLPASGNGGAIVTNDRDLYEFAYNYRNNGKSDWHQMSGTNSRMSELDCAHLLVRANYLDNWQWRRKQIRYYYLEQFKNLPLRCLSRDFPVHADQKFVVCTENRDDLHAHLQKYNIESKVHYPYALSELPIARWLKKPDIISTSVMLTKGVLSLPIYPEMTDGEIEHVSTVICEYYDK